MSHEAMLETIKAELDDADAATLQSVRETLRQAKQNPAELPAAVGGQTSLRSSTSTASEEPLVFIGENPPFDPNRTLSFKERAAAKRRLKAQNREWLLQKFKELKAAWLMIVDGQVIASGATLSEYPKKKQILAVCHQIGKFPFLFINEEVMAIEESRSSWHLTNAAKDFYPTVAVTFRSDKGAVVVVADFDTGASSTYVDYDFLVQQNVIQLEVQEEVEDGRHLGQIYEYLAQDVFVDMVLASGKVLSREVTVACVADWQGSPFVKINPKRTALVGREVFLKLQPRVKLDFKKLETEISSPSRQRHSTQKKLS